MGGGAGARRGACVAGGVGSGRGWGGGVGGGGGGESESEGEGERKGGQRAAMMDGWERDGWMARSVAGDLASPGDKSLRSTLLTLAIQTRQPCAKASLRDISSRSTTQMHRDRRAR